MATRPLSTAPPPPSFAHVKQEHQSIPSPSPPTPAPPPPPPPPPLLSLVKNEPQDLQIVPLHQPKEAPFSKSIDQLCNLSAAIDEFYRRYDELQKHLDFVHSAMDSHEQHHQPPQPQTPAPAPIPPMPTERSTVNTKADTATTSTAPPTAAGGTKSELLSLCEMMCGRGLRKYITTHLSSIRKLRVEVSSALKCSPNPAKLVLDCIGRFYLQGIRAYTKNSPMIPGRKASILVLEFFLLIIDDGVEFDSAVKQEAEQAAVAWRKRLIAEGGLGKAGDMDSRGLLLFIGCYGIPKVFTDEDVLDLVRLSNPKQIVDALRRSRALVARISDILERMMNNGMKVEAVDVAYTFGIEDKFPPQKLLTLFMRDSNEALKRKKRDANNSPILLKEANDKQLAALKSVMKLLEDRKLDPTKLLPGWQVREMIDKLEKENADINRKIDEMVMQKRKADENDFLNNLKIPDAKRTRYTSSPLISSPSIGLHEQRAAGLVDGNGLYSTSVRMNLLDGGFSGHINNPPVAGSILYGSGVGSLSERVLGQVAAAGGNVMHGAGVGLSSSYGIPSSSSFAGVCREMLVDRTGQIIGSSSVAYGWHGVGDTGLIDGSRGKSFVHQPVSGLFGPSPMIEGFAGLPNSPAARGANRSSTSDLYRFADAVK